MEIFGTNRSPDGSSFRILLLAALALAVFAFASYKAHLRSLPPRNVEATAQKKFCYELDNLTTGVSLYIMDARPIDFTRVKEVAGCVSCKSVEAFPVVPPLSKITVYREDDLLGVRAKGPADERLAKVCK